jgi:hypothetical protein
MPYEGPSTMLYYAILAVMFVNLSVVVSINRFEQKGGHIQLALKRATYTAIVVVPLLMGAVAIYVNNS